MRLIVLLDMFICLTKRIYFPHGFRQILSLTPLTKSVVPSKHGKLFLKPTMPCTISAARCWLRGTAPNADTSRLYPSDPSSSTSSVFPPLPRDPGTHHYHITKPQLDYL
ncbi:uncharacterized protein TNCV_2952961 [Trichonephila clavipes]|nr:uncharacterized protein TNCV_2952961 [Trichonephila clavipes]